MDAPLLIKTRRIVQDSPAVTIDYPIIYGMHDHEVENEMNTAIIDAYNDLLIEQNFHDPSLIEMTAGYEIKTNERAVLSLNLIVYSFTGGAHGMTIVKSLTFDASTGKQYSLPDLFKNGSSYVKVLSDVIREQIKESDLTLLNPPFTTIRDDQDFYLADTSIVIYFQLYELAAYVYGFPYFPIPLKDLEKIILPGSPAERLASFT